MTTQPSPLATPQAWNLVAPGYAEVSFDEFAAFARDALEFAEIRPDERVLDVATGPGSLSLQAAAIAREVCAIDFSPRMLAELHVRMEARGLRNLDVREGDGQALPWADGSFDAAFSMFGLIFFPDRAKGFAELHRVLRPGGRAVVSSWQPMSNVPLLVQIFEALAAELPQVPFGDGKGPLSKPADLRREMEQAGFEVTIVERSHPLSIRDFESFWRDLRRSLAPLVLLEHRLGAEAFVPVAARIERRLRAHVTPGMLVEQPALLALGRRAC